MIFNPESVNTPKPYKNSGFGWNTKKTKKCPNPTCTKVYHKNLPFVTSTPKMAVTPKTPTKRKIQYVLNGKAPPQTTKTCQKMCTHAPPPQSTPPKVENSTPKTLIAKTMMRWNPCKRSSKTPGHDSNTEARPRF